MVDITFKNTTLRQAIARATVRVSAESTITRVEQRTVPKGDIFEFSRAAALLAIKKTSDVIPDCHPLPVEFAAVRYTVKGLEIEIEVEVHTVYKTGVEVEAMHGASVAALVMYDMLKPIDSRVEIGNISLLDKKGGKSSHPAPAAGNLKAAVGVCSDRVSAGQKEDASGHLLVKLLEEQGFSQIRYFVVPDAIEAIRKNLENCKGEGVDLLLLTGGTGLSDRDVTPEAVEPYITRQIPGIMETFRNYGQQRVKTAMLSRGIAGFAEDMLVLTLPGSPGSVKEAVKALFPQILHVFEVRRNKPHT